MFKIGLWRSHEIIYNFNNEKWFRAFRTLYQDDPTFKNIYTTVAGNIGGYTLGLIGGFLHYYMEKNGTKLAEKKVNF